MLRARAQRLAGAAARAWTQRARMSTGAPGPEAAGSSFVQRAIFTVAASGLALSVFELGRWALNWPEPCEQLLERARTTPELVEMLGGAPVRLAHPLWDGQVGEHSVRVTLPLRGAGKTRATLYGAAVKGPDGKWQLLNGEVHVLKEGASSSSGSAAKAGGASSASGMTLRSPLQDPSSGVVAVFDLLAGKKLRAEDFDTVETLLKAPKGAGH